MSDDLAVAALELAACGLRVHPLHERSKVPMLKAWPEIATTDEAIIAEWWGTWPQANIGVATGGDLAVLDCDPRDGGDWTLAALVDRHGPLPPTPQVATGGDGSHWYFAAPPGLRSIRLGDGLELKSEGAQVVAPPSAHPNGRTYVWAGGHGPVADRSLAALPQWIVDLAGREAPEARQTSAKSSRGGEITSDGDPLKSIGAAEFVFALTGREPNGRGYVRCPFHAGGQERTPSLKLYATTWFCFACSFGGDIYDLAGRIAGYSMPLGGRDFLTVRDALLEGFSRKAAA